MHLIDIGYTFKGCHVFVQTDTPGVACKLRKLLYEKILESMNSICAPDLHDPDPWEDPLERVDR